MLGDYNVSSSRLLRRRVRGKAKPNSRKQNNRHAQKYKVTGENVEDKKNLEHIYVNVWQEPSFPLGDTVTSSVIFLINTGSKRITESLGSATIPAMLEIPVHQLFPVAHDEPIRKCNEGRSAEH